MPIDEEGYAFVPGAIPGPLAVELATSLEAAIDAMAAELGVSREAYLQVACRWSSPNPVVTEMADQLVPRLTARVHAAIGAAEPVKAAVFRKSRWAQMGTHGHQDAGYWVTPRSTTYDLTTWIALEDVTETNGALRVLAGSHCGEIAPAVDYLARGFVDPAAAWASRARTIEMAAGDMLLFGPRLWHASHACAPDRTRWALVIRWRRMDAVHSEDSQGVPTPQHGGFGMFTSGEYLKRALEQLAGRPAPAVVAERIQWALSVGLLEGLPDPDAARRALERLLLYHRAWSAHGTSAQRGMVWEAVRDLVVAPVLGAAVMGRRA